MKTKLALGISLCAASMMLSSMAFGQLLYSENFDDGQAVDRWTAQAGVGWSDPDLLPRPMDTNFDTEPFSPGVDGINDNFSGFAFDYSTAGVPPAPGSNGTTIGLKLQSSLFSNVLGGFSANPNDLNLTGDYSVQFDVWASTVGGAAGFPTGGSGSTMLSTFGILTTGTASETILSSDGVFFAATGDGGSASDFRAYSVEDKNSYDGTAGEPNATYHAGSRNGTAQLYIDAVGGDVTVPQSVKDAFPGQNMEGVLSAGATAFQWHHHEIRKIGNIVEWYMNDFKLITVDMTNFATPTLGGNISFGHADINFASSVDINAGDLLFTLIDNIEVHQLTPGGVEDADFDGNGIVDGRDFLTWQRGFGIDDGTAQLGDGDANEDGNVDGADLVVWQGQYGTSPQAAVAAVPEPATIVSVLFATAFIGLGRRKAVSSIS